MGHRPRVLYILAQYPGPTETFIAREISALTDSGVYVWVYAFRSQGARSTNPRLQVICRRELTLFATCSVLFRSVRRHPLRVLGGLATLAPLVRRPSYFLRAVRNAFWAVSLIELIDRHRIDRIHAHFADIPSDTALFLSRLAGIPLSFSVHARDVFVAPVELARKCRAADVVFACNGDAARSARFESARVVLIHHGLKFESSIWDDVYRYRSRRNWSPATRGSARILAVGRFVPKKGFHILLGALELLRRRGTSFVADLVGGGPEFSTLANLVSEYGFSQNVRLWNFLTHAELYKFWCECDVFVQPSIVDPEGDRDGIPNVVIEALACGIPVIASDLPGIREVIRHERTGFLCPPGDQVTLAGCIERVLSVDCRALSELGRQYVRTHFDIGVSIAQILNAWRLPAPGRTTSTGTRAACSFSSNGSNPLARIATHFW